MDGTGEIVGIGEVNTSVPGVYLLSYNYTDFSGNEAMTVVREVTVINLPPEDLYIVSDTNLSIHENEPKGTIIASLHGIDQNPDSLLSYRLIGPSDAESTVDQNKTEGNSSDLLYLDESGVLSSARPLDFESDPSEIPILVRVTDQHGGYFEKHFRISLLNVVEDLDGDGIEDHYDPDDDGDGYEDIVEVDYGFNPFDRWDYPMTPLVRTAEIFEQNHTLLLGARILSSGGYDELEVGVMIFDEVGILISAITKPWVKGGESTVYFEIEKASIPTRQITYHAYAENLAGRTNGQSIEYWIKAGSITRNWWESDAELDGGWRESSWFGTYLPNLKNQWVYHFQFGWVFAQPDGQDGFWLWMPEEEWVWTKATVWPFLWSNTSSDWLYPLYSSGKRYVYDYSKESIR